MPELLFFRRQSIAIHEQELGTVQANALCAVAFGAGDVTHGTDVGADFNLMTIQRDRRQILQLGQFVFSLIYCVWTAFSASIVSAVGFR